MTGKAREEGKLEGRWVLAEEEARPAFTALSIVENSLPKRLSTATAAQGRAQK